MHTQQDQADSSRCPSLHFFFRVEVWLRQGQYGKYNLYYHLEISPRSRDMFMCICPERIPGCLQRGQQNDPAWLKLHGYEVVLFWQQESRKQELTTSYRSSPNKGNMNSERRTGNLEGQDKWPTFFRQLKLYWKWQVWVELTFLWSHQTCSLLPCSTCSFLAAPVTLLSCFASNNCAA